MVIASRLVKVLTGTQTLSSVSVKIPFTVVTLHVVVVLGHQLSMHCDESASGISPRAENRSRVKV